MKGYKAFEKGLVCKGKQYEENTVFEEEKAEICNCGMHFCENPLDVLDYYPLLDNNCEFVEVAEVEALDEVKTDDKKKYCTKKLKIGAKLSFSAFVKAAIEFVFEKVEKDKSQLAASGNGSQLAASGYGSKLAASGYGSQLAASGNESQLAASGNGSQLAASGDGSQLAASGDGSKLAASGNDSIVAGIGINNIAKAKKGSWIILAEWIWEDKGCRYIPKYVKSVKVDGKEIKEDKYYKLQNGKFIEVI